MHARETFIIKSFWKLKMWQHKRAAQKDWKQGTCLQEVEQKDRDGKDKKIADLMLGSSDSMIETVERWNWKNGEE